MPRGNGGIIGPANIPTQGSAKGVWSMKEIALAVRQSIWPFPNAGSDPFFEYTTLLLPGNGTNGAQNNTFLDSSTNNFTITRNGNTTQGTFSPFSQTGWGGFASATGQYLTAATNTQFNLSSSNFTVEAWIYPTAFNTYNYIYSRDGATNATSEIDFYFGATGNITANFYSGSSNYNANSSGGALTLNRWQHVALVRNGGTLTIYVEGTSVATNSSLSTLAANTTTIAANILNSAGAANRGMQGYCSNFRLTIGVAVYTANFTAPTSPLTATQSAGTNISAITGTQTKILTLQSNRFVDNSVANSGAGWTLTVNGSLSVQAFSPFNPTSSWSATTNGGSGYFDGSGDYLSIANNSAFDFGAGEFTLEFWWYPTTVSANQNVMSKWWTGGQQWVVQWRSAGYFRFAYNSSNLIDFTGAPSTPIANAWNHIAIVRSVNSLYLYLNGVRNATVGTISATLTATTDPFVFGQFNNTALEYFTGYASGLVVVKGGALYTGATLTVPTTPPTTTVSSGTVSALLNFTNAGIYDATSKNDLETVGNAQISTTQSKWGSTSIKFDGTGDWLLQPSSSLLSFGTGDYTVEMWLYRSNTTGDMAVLDGRSGSTGYLLYLNASNKLLWYVNAGIITGSTTIGSSQWYHIAISRSGTSVKLFVDGVQDGSATNSTSTDSTGLTVGAKNTASSIVDFNGYIQDLRITKGYARYTANFTPPTAAFPTL